MVGKHEQAVQIPSDALTRLDELQYVYVVKDGTAFQTPVEVGDRVGNRIEITKGLTGEEQVIVSGKDLVSHGTPVEAHLLNETVIR
jgi:multidrug efflux pump subunit AcrA (membrane-fusion protein)